MTIVAVTLPKKISKKNLKKLVKLMSEMENDRRHEES